MKKLVLLVVLVASVQLAAQAQLRFGVTAGLQSSRIKVSAGGRSASSDGILGIHLGGVAEYAINDNIVIRPQLGLSFKGGRINDYGDVIKTSLAYLDLPIHAVYKYELGSGKLFGGIGPYLGFLLGGTDDGEKIEVGDEIKGFDAGLSLLGGYELTEKKLSFNFFYNPGLVNISPSIASGIVTSRNRTFGVSASYFFGE